MLMALGIFCLILTLFFMMGTGIEIEKDNSPAPPFVTAIVCATLSVFFIFNAGYYYGQIDVHLNKNHTYLKQNEDGTKSWEYSSTTTKPFLD